MNTGNEDRNDVIVIGAGVIGASVALELQRGGRQVVVVDKGTAVGGGSTSSSASVIRYTYSTRAGVVASWEAKHAWERWAEHLGVDSSDHAPLCTFHQIGFLLLNGPEADPAPMLDHFERVGVPYELLDADALARRFPGLDPGRFGPPTTTDDHRFFSPATGSLEGVFLPDGGFVDDPQLAAVNLMDAARRNGARVRLRTRVTGFLLEETSDGRRVAGVALDDGSDLRAPVVVNVAGPWSSRINRLAGATGDITVPSRAMRQDLASTAAPVSFGVGHGGTVVADMDFGTYFRPQPGGSFLVGGVEAACDPAVYVDDPDEASRRLDGALVETLALRAARRIPALELPRRPQGLVDFYDATPDWVPVYDRSSLDGYYLATGTSGNQFKNAPVVGQLMAALIDACESGHDHDAEPVQFHCPHTGQLLDLGQFSRRRQPASTSGTVMG